MLTFELLRYWSSIVTDEHRSSRPEVFLGKGALKTSIKFTWEYSCRSAISVKLQSNFIEIALWHGCSPVNFLHIFRTSSLKNTSEWLLLQIAFTYHSVFLNINCSFEFWRLYCTSKLWRSINKFFFLNFNYAQFCYIVVDFHFQIFNVNNFRNIRSFWCTFSLDSTKI